MQKQNSNENFQSRITSRESTRSASNGMKVLMISNDKKILESGSVVRKRMEAYSSLFGALSIIVFSSGTQNKPRISSDTLAIYPTNSKSKGHYIFDAIRIGKRLGKFDVVTAQDTETGFAAWRLAKHKNAMFQLQFHTDVFSPYFGAHSFLNRIRVLLAKFLITKADCIRVVSKRIKDSLAGLGNKNYESSVSVLPIYVDIEKIRGTEPKFDLHKKYPQFDFIVLTVGRLAKEKNHELAIHAFRRVLADHPRAGLVIVGDGPEINSLKLQTTNYKLQTNVIFEGWQDDLVSYYKTADVFLLASDYEGFGLALVEAAAAGISIVTTDVGLIGDILKQEESARVCPVGDEACLAKEISLFIERKNLRSLYTLRAQSAIERLNISFEKYLGRFRNSFTQCLTKREKEKI